MRLASNAIRGLAMDGPACRVGLMSALSLMMAAGCEDLPARNPTGPTPMPVSSAQAVLVGAGDIAECGLPGAEATARLLDTIPGTVFTAGDNAYYRGSREEYQGCYDPTRGRHKSRTRPIPGNHDYETPGAADYYAYFGAAAAPSAPGFYSFELGAWHIVALNSNIPLDAGSAQLVWLRSDLAQHRTRCAAALVHHPRFSSGMNGSDARLTPLWDLLYAEGTEVVVSGHDHLYERFGAQDPGGRADPARGIRQFVAGTGGAQLTSIRAVVPNSEVRASVWGVLKFTLRDSDYDWEFVPVAEEAFRDRGTDVCR